MNPPKKQTHGVPTVPPVGLGKFLLIKSLCEAF